jgi:RNA-directed DNA polymerase
VVKASTSTIDWALMDWRKAERSRYRLQKRIYKAASLGKREIVHNLQRKLMSSWSNRVLSVRKVTQDNQGKKTAGIDGQKDLTAAERVTLVKELVPQRRKRRKHLPVRRVWIPKPGKTEMRPLGIPTIRDRAEQAMAKEALEPEWEAKFEPNSYGFRPGRSCHDAIEAIFLEIRYKPKYVVDADIRGCFEHINHEALLNKLETYPAMRHYVSSCLKAGIMENLKLSESPKKGMKFLETKEGTPQGGVVSPLLANIALHGLEKEIRRGYSQARLHPQVIRYADDFLIFCPDKGTMMESRRRAEQWLKGIGLELKPEKTRFTHTLNKYEGNLGLDFLGFQVRQYKVGKSHSGKNTHGKLLGFKTLIKPSKEGQKRHLLKMKGTVRKHRGSSQGELITSLNKSNPGWARYYRTVVSKVIYSKMDQWMYTMLAQWARWRHRNKGAQWRYDKYWHRQEGRTEFSTPEGLKLIPHAHMDIRRHVKVEGAASPYDGRLAYWAKRNYEHPLTKSRNGILLRKQQGKCAWCGYYFRDEDLIELDHFVPKRLGGKDTLSNLQALHRHCHDRKTAREGEAVSPEPTVFDDNEPGD